MAFAQTYHLTRETEPFDASATKSGLSSTILEDAIAFQPVIDTTEINVIYTLNGKTVQNVFYAELVGGYIQADLDALALRVDTRVAANWIDQQPAEAIYQRTEVRGLAVQNDLMADFTTGPLVGTQLGAALPNNVTFAVKQTSGFSGRSARGRVYWIGIPNDKLEVTNENLLIAGFSNAIVLVVGQIREGIEAISNWSPVLVSRVTAGLPRPTGLTFPWIAEVAVNGRVDSQRGRLPSI